MCNQVKQSGITLQIGSQVDFLVNNPVQVINCLFVISTTEIKTGDLIIKYKNPMRIKIKSILFQHFFQVTEPRQIPCEISLQKIEIDAGSI